MNLIENEKPAIQAWLICTIASHFLAILADHSYSLLYMVSGTISISICFIFLRFLTGKERSYQVPPYDSTPEWSIEPLTTWSYIWRFTISYLISGFILIPVLALQLINSEKANYELALLAVFTATFPLTVLILFCPNRKQKIKDILSFLKSA